MKRILTIIASAIFLCGIMCGCAENKDTNRSGDSQAAEAESNGDTHIITSTVEENISAANSMAKTVHTSASYWVMTMNIDDSAVSFDTIHVCDGKDQTTGTNGCELIDLEDDFKGYWLFKTNNNGESVSYSLYSEEPIDEDIRFADSEEQEQYYIDTGVIVGCYPFKG